MATTTRGGRIDWRGHYINNVYFKDGLWLTSILCSLLFLVLAISLDAAGHVAEGLGILLPVTMGALFTGILMSFSRFDSFFAFAHSMFAGLAWILFLMSRNVDLEQATPILEMGVPEFQARAYFVLVRLINWTTAALNDKISADNYAFIFEIALLVWWLAYLGIWSILRHGYTWRAVVPAGIVLLINTYYAPQQVFSFLFVFALLALILLIRTNLAELQLRWREQYIYFSQDIGWDFMRNGVWYSLIALALALLIPDLGRNPLVRQAFSPIEQRWIQTQREMQDVFQGLNRRTDGTGAGFGQSLTLGGERQVDDTPLFQVDVPIARYWRATVFDTYTGTSWVDSSKNRLRVEAAAFVPIGDWPSRQLISQTLTLLAPMGTQIIAPPDLRQSSLAIDAFISGVPALPLFGGEPIKDTETGAIEFTLTQTDRDLVAGDSYIVASNAVNVSEAQLQRAGVEYPASIKDRYTQLPENFSAKVSQTAIETVAGLVTPYDQAKAIERYLRTIPYNDTISAAPAGTDPVEYFLYEIRQGYCDYYATSMGVMLRSLGIPARTASGYAKELPDAQYYADQQELRGEDRPIYTVTSRDAHTWVEVFFPGLGWIEFEPTASEQELTRPKEDLSSTATLNDQRNGADQLPPEQPTPSLNNQPDFPPEQLPQDGGVFAGQGNRLPWWAWLILAPVLLGGGLWLLWRYQTQGPSAFTPELSPILYERLQRWADRLRMGSLPHHTPFEQAKRLTQLLPEVERPINLVTDSYVQYRFAPQEATETQAAKFQAERNQKQLVSAWRDLFPALWRKWLKQVVRWWR